MVVRDLYRRLRSEANPALAAAGLAAVVGMLTGGLFEYNFGDSEFLMLFLVLMTLPAAAAYHSTVDPSVGSHPGKST